MARATTTPLAGARFFVTHTSREKSFLAGGSGEDAEVFGGNRQNSQADASDEEIEDLISKLKTLKEDKFADLLYQCHNCIRSREKVDPPAFGEIAKILFVKLYIERELRAERQHPNLPLLAGS